MVVQRVLEDRVPKLLEKLLLKPSLVSAPPMEEGGLILVSNMTRDFLLRCWLTGKEWPTNWSLCCSFLCIQYLRLLAVAYEKTQELARDLRGVGCGDLDVEGRNAFHHLNFANIFFNFFVVWMCWNLQVKNTNTGTQYITAFHLDYILLQNDILRMYFYGDMYKPKNYRYSLMENFKVSWHWNHFVN